MCRQQKKQDTIRRYEMLVFFTYNKAGPSQSCIEDKWHINTCIITMDEPTTFQNDGKQTNMNLKMI